MSRSTRLATIRTTRMSTIEATGAFVLANAPGSRKRLPTKPSTGDDDLRVRQRDLQLVEPRLGLLELRPRQVELRQRRLMPRVDVVERLLRQQLAIEEVLRAIEVGLRQLEIGLALPDRRFADLVGGFGLAHLLANLAVLDARDHLAFAHRVAELDVDRLEATVHARHDLHGRGADQVADDEDLLADRRALRGGELDRHRRPSRAAPAAARGRAPGGARRCRVAGGVAAAVVEQDAGDPDHGNDGDDDGSTHGFLRC